MTRSDKARVPLSPDLITATILFCLSLAFGIFYLSRLESYPNFYQHYFGPSVMLACGQGFVEPVSEQAQTPLKRFLSVALTETQTVESSPKQLTCEDLPVNLLKKKPHAFQATTRYLLAVVAFVWMLTEISWPALTPLFGLLFALTVTLAYAIFRLGMGRWLAIAGALMMMISTLHLTYLPHLRDYAKAPFILALILIVGWLVTWPLKRSTVLTLAGAAGVVLGVGLGFRADLLINILPFGCVLFLFLPGSVLANLKLKFTALLLFLGTFVLVGWPIIAAYQSGNNLWHVILLGLTTRFDQELGVTGSIYEYGYLFNDTYVNVMVNSYASKALDQSVLLPISSKGYEQATLQYFLEVVKNFPADLVIRGYASILKILNLPVETFYVGNPPVGFEHGFFSNLYTWRFLILSPLYHAGLLCTALALLILSTTRMRLAVFLLFFILYFGGYPMLEFQPRNYFHLEFMGWWAIGFVVSQVSQFILSFRSRQTDDTAVQFFNNRSRWGKFLGYWSCLIFLILVPLSLLRNYQHTQVTNMLARFLEAEQVPFSAQSLTPQPNSQLLVSQERPKPVAIEDNLTIPVPHIEYIMAEFSAATCDYLDITITLRYETSIEHLDFSRTMIVNLPKQGSTQLFFPVYEFSRLNLENQIEKSHFKGLELPEAKVACLTNLQLMEYTGQIPLLLTVTLPPHWEQLPLYQILTAWETGAAPTELPNFYSYPPDLDVTWSMFEVSQSHLNFPNLAYQANILEMKPDKLVVAGEADAPFSFLLNTGNLNLKKGDIFVFQGELARGGFRLGFIKDKEWVGRVDNDQPGDFTVILEVPADDTYSLVMANLLRGDSLENQFQINRVGWLRK